MLKLAESSGTVIYEDGNKLYITKKPAQWIGGLFFAFGLAAFLFLTYGFLKILFFNTHSNNDQAAGLILLASGGVFALIFWRIALYRNKINAIPGDLLKRICIIDLTANDLLDDQENFLAPLHAVQLKRKRQLTSRSPSLVLTWNKNTLTLVEGNPFSGGIAAVEKALISKGINR